MAVSLYCPHCNKHTALRAADVLVRHNGYEFTVDARWLSGFHHWWIGVCNACQLPSLVMDSGQKIYPSPRPSPTDTNIPKNIANDLDEAKLCYSNGCYRACAVMARRCIQAACIAMGCTTKQLVDQIAELQTNGIITKEVQLWATAVRWIGNDAAHPDKIAVTEEDALDSLNLAEQFMHIVFVTPAQTKSRITARKRSKP